MARLHQQPICLASSLFVPWLTLAAPTWVSLSGVGPCWAVLWLLPWALVDGPVSGFIAALFPEHNVSANEFQEAPEDVSRSV